MIGAESLWSFLVYSAVLTGVGLLLGSFAAWRVRQPADRLRLIQWVLVCCLVAPWLPGLSVWKSIPLDLMSVPDRSEVTQNMEVAVHHAGPSETTIHEAAPTVAASPAIVVGSTPEVPQASIAERKPVPAEVSSSEPPAILASKSPLESLTYSDVTEWLVLIYLGIVAATVLWWMLGLWRRVCLERSAAPASTLLQELFTQMAGSTNRRVRLLVSDRISGPMTWGLIHPVIIVPTRFAESPDAPSLRWSLAHELSHVERRDFGTLLLACGAQLVCFYQPLYWWLRRQMSLCQDYLADARAAQVTGSPEDYAEFLVRVAESRLQPILPATLGIVDRQSELFHRVKMLLSAEGELRSRCSRTVALGSFLGALTFVALAGAIQLEAQEGAAPPKANGPKTAIVDPSTSAAASPAATKNVDASLDESKLEEGVVTGVVFNAADESPVADATIILQTAPKRETRSDAQGRFRFENVAPGDESHNLWAQRGNLVSHVWGASPLRLTNPKIVKFAPVRLKMMEGKRATIRAVSEATRRPIAGASIKIGFTAEPAPITDERGVATTSRLAPLKYNVVIEANGYARASALVDLSGADSEYEYTFTLKEGGVIAGAVVDSEGKPASNARVNYGNGDPGSVHGDGVRTNAEGRFRLPFVPLDVPIAVFAVKGDSFAERQSVVLTAKARELEVRLALAARELPSGLSIKGKVTDPSGRPIVGAQVSNQGNRSDHLRFTNTDAAGNFTLHDLYTGLGSEIYVAAKGFSPQRVQVKPGTMDQPSVVEVSLQPGHVIRGQVKIEGDVSPRGTRVSVQSANYASVKKPFVTVKEDGLFEFDSLPADAHFDIDRWGYARLWGVRLELDRPEPVVVTLDSPGMIRGRVLDSQTGKPVPQFRIRLNFAQGQSSSQWSFPGNFYDPGVTFSSEKGEFLIQPLTHGMRLELIVEQQGYQQAAIPLAVAAKGEQATPVEISLYPLDASKLRTLSGQFLDHVGAPKSGAQLRLIVSKNEVSGSDDRSFDWMGIKNGQLARRSHCEQLLSGVTNSEGRFEFKQVRPGKGVLLAYWGVGIPQGKSLAFEESKPGESKDVIIRLPQPATIHGSIDRSKFREAGSIDVSPMGEGFAPQYSVELSDNQDKFELTDLPPGEYSLTIMSKRTPYSKDGRAMSRRSSLASQRVKLAAGEVKKVQIPDSETRFRGERP